jgi:hypothetical protein
MRTILVLLAFAGQTGFVCAQSVHVGVFGGMAAYSGDLVEKIFPKKLSHAVVGISGNYELADHFMIRGQVSYTQLEGADRYNKDTVLARRNLSFKTKLAEFQLTGEFYLLNLYDRRYSPYLFAGLAIYHFNPYAFDVTGTKVFLKPLSTEGQGIAGYPERKPYKLTQFALPFGGGVKFAINDNLRAGIEVGIRKLFTDYIDDVSSNYADATDLLNARGELAVQMAYRGDEVPGGDPFYPAKGDQRGGAENLDYYYFGGIHVTYRLGGEKTGLKNGNGGKGRKSRLGCPGNVF